MSFLFINLRTKKAVNPKISVFAVCVEAIINLVLSNLHDCTLIPLGSFYALLVFNHCDTMQMTWVRFLVQVISTDFPISWRCWANSVYLPSEVGKWVPDNNGANSESSTTRVGPIDYHWWYDRQLSIYDPG